jgi:hypothetical protein
LKQRRTRCGLRFPGAFSGGALRSRALQNIEDVKGSYRKTVDGWHNTDINGVKLLSERCLEIC